MGQANCAGAITAANAPARLHAGTRWFAARWGDVCRFTAVASAQARDSPAAPRPIPSPPHRCNHPEANTPAYVCTASPMPTRLMRKAARSSLLRVDHHASKAPPSAAMAFLTSSCTLVTPVFPPLNRRSLANVRTGGSTSPEAWFTSSGPAVWSEGHLGANGEPPDERTLKLGKSDYTQSLHGKPSTRSVQKDTC